MGETPIPQGKGGRELTEREQAYLRKALGESKSLLVGAFWMALLATIGVNALFVLTFVSGQASLAFMGASLGVDAILVGLTVVLRWGVQTKVEPKGRIRAILGEYRTQAVGAPRSSRTVHFIGEQEVTVPEHWLGSRLRQGEFVHAEALALEVDGVGLLLGDSMMVVLTLRGRASIDGDVSRGLLDMRGPRLVVLPVVVGALLVFLTPYVLEEWEQGVLWGLISVAWWAVGATFVASLIRAVRQHRTDREIRHRLATPDDSEAQPYRMKAKRDVIR